MCDLNPKKRCNNCGKCIDDAGDDFRSLTVEDFLEQYVTEDDFEELLKEEDEAQHNCHDQNCDCHHDEHEKHHHDEHCDCHHHGEYENHEHHHGSKKK
jgi:hypothetical protein